MSDRTIKRLSQAGFERPRPPYPGKLWQPHTDAEGHLLREGFRLDRARQLLLVEIGRLRAESGTRSRQDVTASAAREAERLRECPLAQRQWHVIAAAAAGETVEGTAARMFLTCDAIKSHRQRALLRLNAHNLTHAVAICVAAGWVSAAPVEEGAAR
ncbi:LuxR C-terminal-related transcriptional regulator [Streptomyces sp. NBC_00986]|uniref:helix-turn-helix transcriptional regulator n=1 Tax=Streptomyces sp. NBC_00986 TaxID=2903702 RepID=UPI003866CB06|nr:LuxR C-terminal-related transcriptional regulator [Streptomyces sp. NBC_00986]